MTLPPEAAHELALARRLGVRNQARRRALGRVASLLAGEAAAGDGGAGGGAGGDSEGDDDEPAAAVVRHRGVDGGTSPAPSPTAMAAPVPRCRLCSTPPSHQPWRTW